MGFRFSKRVNILPGVSMNFSKSGPSFSFGPKGLKYTVGPKGTRTTLGVPGTGLYYTTSKSWSNTSTNIPQQSDPFNNVGFFKQMLMSPSERQLVHGLQALSKGRTGEAKDCFRQGFPLLDCVFLYGYLVLGEGSCAEAETSFSQCFMNIQELGKTIGKIDANFELLLAISEYIEGPIQIDGRGLGLAMVEALQKQNKHEETYDLIEQLCRSFPNDKVVKLSAIDFIAQASASSREQQNFAVELSSNISNDEPIDTNILYLRAYVFYQLDLVDAAVNQLTDILRKTKNRSEELMMDIRFLRGQIYELSGQKTKSKKDYEMIYSKNPNYQDVAERLGVK